MKNLFILFIVLLIMPLFIFSAHYDLEILGLSRKVFLEVAHIKKKYLENTYKMILRDCLKSVKKTVERESSSNQLFSKLTQKDLSQAFLLLQNRLFSNNESNQMRGLGDSFLTEDLMGNFIEKLHCLVQDTAEISFDIIDSLDEELLKSFKNFSLVQDNINITILNQTSRFFDDILAGVDQSHFEAYTLLSQSLEEAVTDIQKIFISEKSQVQNTINTIVRKMELQLNDISDSIVEFYEKQLLEATNALSDDFECIFEQVAKKIFEVTAQGLTAMATEIQSHFQSMVNITHIFQNNIDNQLNIFLDEHGCRMSDDHEKIKHKIVCFEAEFLCAIRLVEAQMSIVLDRLFPEKIESTNVLGQ